MFITAGWEYWLFICYTRSSWAAKGGEGAWNLLKLLWIQIHRPLLPTSFHIRKPQSCYLKPYTAWHQPIQFKCYYVIWIVMALRCMLLRGLWTPGYTLATIWPENSIPRDLVIVMNTLVSLCEHILGECIALKGQACFRYIQPFS